MDGGILLLPLSIPMSKPHTYSIIKKKKNVVKKNNKDIQKPYYVPLQDFANIHLYLC